MKSTKVKSIVRLNQMLQSSVDDSIAIEEPLEIRLLSSEMKQPQSVSITMRTPGNDEELALGFLYTEGIISRYEQLSKVYQESENIIIVELKSDQKVQIKSLDRNFYTSSSCGVCGKASIDAIRVNCNWPKNQELTQAVKTEILYHLPEILNTKQLVFESTGGIHASVLYTLDGDFIELREDVGRHNALDKLIGHFFIQDKIPLNNHILLLSGRASFELIQKAMMAGIRMIVAVGAPSSLAIELAEENNITLIGFLKSNRMNIYSGFHRISGIQL